MSREFGGDVATADGALDRSRDAAPGLLPIRPRGGRLEAILHLMIRELCWRTLSPAISPYVILAVPLWSSPGTYRQRCDRVPVVDCPESLQVSGSCAQRFVETDVRAILADPGDARERLAAAMPTFANDAGGGLPRRRLPNCIPAIPPGGAES